MGARSDATWVSRSHTEALRREPWLPSIDGGAAGIGATGVFAPRCGEAASGTLGSWVEPAEEGGCGSGCAGRSGKTAGRCPLRECLLFGVIGTRADASALVCAA